MGKVQSLNPHEVVRQDVGTIAEIYRNLGAPVAEQLVTRALGELALALVGLRDRVQANDLHDLGWQLDRLRRLAKDIGLSSLATVSSDAATCLERGDATAFAAVWARMMRVAGSSLSVEAATGGFLD